MLNILKAHFIFLKVRKKYRQSKTFEKGTVFDRLMKTYYQSIIQQEIYWIKPSLKNQ